MAITPTLRSVKKEENRQSISRAAMKLFQEYSFEDVTVSDICSHCNISIGTFYHLFGSKSNTLFLSVAVNRDRYITDHFTLDEAQPFFPQFRDFIMVNIAYNSSVSKTLLGSTYSAYVTQKCAQNMLPGRPYVDCLQALVERGLELGAFALDLDSRELVKLLNATIIGIAVDWCAHNAHDDTQLCARFATQLIQVMVKQEFQQEQ